jgi:hypothetical protein
MHQSVNIKTSFFINRTIIKFIFFHQEIINVIKNLIKNLIISYILIVKKPCNIYNNEQIIINEKKYYINVKIKFF